MNILQLYFHLFFNVGYSLVKFSLLKNLFTIKILKFDNMCYKVHTPLKEKLIAYLGPGKFDVRPYEFYFHADGFTMPFLPVSTSETPNIVQPGIWKLLPQWVKNDVEARKYANTLNATAEEIFEKASYKNYITRNRCLVWVDGFFEPHHPDAKTTIPYYIYSADGNPFSLGGVYSNWVNQDTGEVIKTFSIITTPANELLGQIHNEKKRMPLIISPSDREKWLGPLSKEEIIQMMVPLPDGILAAYPVSGLVYNKRVDSNVPEVLLPGK